MYSLSIVSVIAVYSYAHWSLTWSPRPLSFQYSSFLPSIMLPFLCAVPSLLLIMLSPCLLSRSVFPCLPTGVRYMLLITREASWWIYPIERLLIGALPFTILHEGEDSDDSTVHYLLMCSWGHKLSISRKCCDFSFNFPSTVVTKHFYPCCCHSHQTKILM